MKSKLVSALAVVLFPLISQAAILTGADLPGLGQTLTITEDSQLVITGAAFWGGGTISIGSGLRLDFLNQNSSLQGAGNINNYNAYFNLYSDGFLGGGYNFNNFGWGTVNVQNSGFATGTLNFSTYGGSTNFQNNGVFTGTLNVLDQYDSSHIMNNGNFFQTTINLTANGDMGFIQFSNNGLINSISSNNQSNYGGEVEFYNFGLANFNTMTINTPGTSHGKDSMFFMHYNKNVTSDNLYVYGQLQDTSFLSAGLDQVFAYPADGSDRVFFNGIGPEPVPEPCTLLLLCFGLMGLAAFRKILNM